MTTRPRSGKVYQADVERMVRAARKIGVPVAALGLLPDGTVVTLPEAPKTERVSTQPNLRLVDEKDIAF
jgi:hypothetical protein